MLCPFQPYLVRNHPNCQTLQDHLLTSPHPRIPHPSTHTPQPQSLLLFYIDGCRQTIPGMWASLQEQLVITWWAVQRDMHPLYVYPCSLEHSPHGDSRVMIFQVNGKNCKTRTNNNNKTATLLQVRKTFKLYTVAQKLMVSHCDQSHADACIPAPIHTFWSCTLIRVWNPGAILNAASFIRGVSSGWCSNIYSINTITAYTYRPKQLKVLFAWSSRSVSWKKKTFLIWHLSSLFPVIETLFRVLPILDKNKRLTLKPADTECAAM